MARRRDGLRATAQRVVVFDEDLCSLATDLLDTLRAASAIGITATHIGEGRLWMVAFGFGLVHGLGFANVLTELGLPAGALAVALVSFNLGVEAGQLVIVCAILPLAYLLRYSSVYPRFILGAGSLSIAAIAFVWLIERSLNLSLIS